VTDGLLAFQLEADLEAMVASIRQDAGSGPIELARRGAEVILRLTDKAHYERPLQIVLELQGVARALLIARPDSMPLANLASFAVQPLPELYGRGKYEGARMRADVRARIEEWLAALDRRAARIDALRIEFSPVARVVSARAIDVESVLLLPEDHVFSGRRIVVGGPEKFIPPNFEFLGEGGPGLIRVPLEHWDGFLTGEHDAPESPEEVRRTVGSLRFETTLL